MITRQTKLQLLVFIVIAITGLSYTGARYAGLSKYFVDEGYVVSAEFVDSGGVFDGAEVTYRGVPVGKVDELVLTEDGVRVDMLLETGTRVPMQTRAVVANRSAVGEQYVDLQPEVSGAPFMEEGQVIPREMTSIPVQPTELLLNLDRFITSVDTDDVKVVLEELGAAFEGTGDDLQRLVDAGDLLTQAATDALPQTLALIRDGRTVLDTQRDTSAQFRSFNEDLASLTGQIRASDPDFRALFANGTQSALATTDLIEANRQALPVLLQNLVTVAQVQNVRLPAISQILVTYPNVVAGGFTVTPDDGTAHFGLVTTQDPGVCQDGYETTTRPFDETTTEPGNAQVFCADDSSETGTQVRGSGNVPRPEGLGPFRGPGTAGYAPGQPAQGPTSGGQAGAATAPGSPTAPSAGVASSSTPLLGDYDPTTGRTTTADGQTFTVGDSAGAAQLFGSRSWEWLLVGPLSR